MKEMDLKSKRKEDVKQLILDAAKQLFLENGFEATSIRKIANNIGYSPTTIYLYYKDKNDIIYTLHQEGFTVLKSQLIALMVVDDPFERLKALGRSYLNFAKENPDYYELMFIHKEPMQYLDNGPGSEIWVGGRQIFAFIVQTIVECQHEGYFLNNTPNYIALQAWGIVHGLCSLHITTRLQKVADENFEVNDSNDLLECAFQTYVNFIERTKDIN